MGRIKGDYINITPLFSKNLDYLIRANNFKKFEIAEKIGVNTSNISRYINGSVKQIGENNLNSLCNFFEINKEIILNTDLQSEYKKNVLKEEKTIYSSASEMDQNDYLNIPIFLKFAKAVDQTYKNDEFYKLFKKTKNKFLDDTGKKKLDMTVIIDMRRREVDLNDIFTEQDFLTDYKKLFNLE